MTEERCTGCNEYRNVVEVACLILPMGHDGEYDNRYIYLCGDCLLKALEELRGK